VARSADFVKDVAQEVISAGGQAIAIAGDVAKAEDCQRAVADTVKAFRRIDGLVNSAYRAGSFVPFEEADLADWRASMDVTLFGALAMVQAVLPQLKAAGGGSIVNVGTMETRKPLPAHGSYTIPKVALQGATRQLAVELGKYGIRVNSAIIGWMWGTPLENYMAAQSKQTGMPVSDIKAAVDATILLGRMPLDQDCARAVLMLLSDYSSEVTGAALDVNGGDYLAL
jgi:NAD(P)-dependent dehydrogenase (short-subunit alcohol dehydrogenase family)